MLTPEKYDKPFESGRYFEILIQTSDVEKAKEILNKGNYGVKEVHWSHNPSDWSHNA